LFIDNDPRLTYRSHSTKTKEQPMPKKKKEDNIQDILDRIEEDMASVREKAEELQEKLENCTCDEDEEDEEDEDFEDEDED